MFSVSQFTSTAMAFKQKLIINLAIEKLFQSGKHCNEGKIVATGCSRAIDLLIINLLVLFCNQRTLVVEFLTFINVQ